MQTVARDRVGARKMADITDKPISFRQLRFPLGHEPAHTREDFIVTPANAAAVSLIDLWPDWPNPLVAVVGEGGTGKSHLAAVWSARSGAKVVSADALNGGDLPDLISAGAVVVEDADRKLSSERVLFHLFNLAREHRAAMMLTARTVPAGWDIALADLKSRLHLLDVAELRAPDDALLAAVLVKLFADRQLRVEKPVIDYLVARMERSMAFAHRLVQALDDEALVQGRGVTKGVARRVLEAFSDEM